MNNDIVVFILKNKVVIKTCNGKIELSPEQAIELEKQLKNIEDDLKILKNVGNL